MGLKTIIRPSDLCSHQAMDFTNTEVNGDFGNQNQSLSECDWQPIFRLMPIHATLKCWKIHKREGLGVRSLYRTFKRTAGLKLLCGKLSESLSETWVLGQKQPQATRCQAHKVFDQLRHGLGIHRCFATTTQSWGRSWSPQNFRGFATVAGGWYIASSVS